MSKPTAGREVGGSPAVVAAGQAHPENGFVGHLRTGLPLRDAVAVPGGEARFGSGSALFLAHRKGLGALVVTQIGNRALRRLAV